jgi:hypothetical protein
LATEQKSDRFPDFQTEWSRDGSLTKQISQKASLGTKMLAERGDIGVGGRGGITAPLEIFLKLTVKFRSAEFFFN